MNILLTGGSGLVGRKLVKKLTNEGFSVKLLTQKASGKPNEFEWNIPEKRIDDRAFENIDAIIHLAGANIMKRWTKSYKKEIYNSRIQAAALLLEYCKKHQVKLQSFISASGISYYGTFTSDQILTEKDGMFRHDFLANISHDWEKQADQFHEIAERVVKIRISPVLSENGGSMESLLKITNLNMASGLGSGKQWFNWIHLEDLCNIFVKSVKDSAMNGVYNAVADEIPTQKEFMKRLSEKRKKFFIPINIPAIFIKMILGEMGEVALEGTRVSNQKLKSEGFVFQYPTLQKAFDQLLK